MQFESGFSALIRLCSELLWLCGLHWGCGQPLLFALLCDTLRGRGLELPVHGCRPRGAGSQPTAGIVNPFGMAGYLNARLKFSPRVRRVRRGLFDWIQKLESAPHRIASCVQGMKTCREILQSLRGRYGNQSEIM